MSIQFTYFHPFYGAENSFIYLLTTILFLLVIISLIKSKFDVLNPSFIYTICLTGFASWLLYILENGICQCILIRHLS